MTAWDDGLERIARGESVTLDLADGPHYETCPWCVKVRGAAVATVCEVACAGSTPMCAECLAMYVTGESDAEVEAAMERVRPAVEAAAFERESSRAMSAARGLGIAVLIALGYVGLIAVYVACVRAWR